MSLAFADTGGFSARQDSRVAAWDVNLDRVELDVIRGERALATDGVVRTDDWHVPDDQGPVPTSLLPRATDILMRQELLLQRITEKLGLTQRHQALVENISLVSLRNHSLPLYLDITA